MAVLSEFGVPVTGETEATLMPKLAYRFRVQFTGLGGSPSATKATRNVITATRPGLTHDEVTVEAYNSRIRLAGKHTWNDITLVLRDDVDSEVVKLIGAQLNKQVNHADQSSAFAGANYKFGMTIETLDGSNDDGSGAAVLEKWTLAGCYLNGVEYGELDYGNSDFVRVTMTIRYDNASHDLGAEDLLDQFPTSTQAETNHKST